MTERRNDARSRRDLLQLALRGTALAGLTNVLPSTLRAGDDVPLERAAVCIYLIGGNDSNNMIVPLDPTSYSAYASARGELALPQDVLLPVSASRQNASFGFHPFLVELRDLYSRGALAVLANTGTLKAPLTRAQAQSETARPDGLFQHSSAAFSTYLPNGVLMQQWAPKVQQPDPREPGPQVFNIGGVSVISPERLNISGPPANNPVIVDRISRSKLRTAFPETTLGSQLQRVARLLEASASLGLTRPMLCATMPGFDTHADQLVQQEQLYAELSQAMSAFYAATEELGIADRVVTYTRSEFSRTLRPNRRHGTEHAWGGHELILGGSVRGGDIYGTFPSLELGGRDDAGNDGVWIPTTGNQQYDATIAYWYGVGMDMLSRAVSGIENFSSTNLGFLG
jgi:uncharacterized protein (DUF1501 family)